jgi:hypothetical protein
VQLLRDLPRARLAVARNDEARCEQPSLRARAVHFGQRTFARYLKRSRREKLAVLLTLGAACAGYLFSLLDPALTLWERLMRVAIDSVVIAGIVAYLREEKKPHVAREGVRAWLMRAQRYAGVTLTILAVALTLFVPGVDPWLKSYRLSLSVILLVALLADAQRPIASQFFARVLALQLIFATVEMGTIFYITTAVDGPIAFSVVRTAARTVGEGLVGNGFSATPFVGAILIQADDTLLRYDARTQRIRATTELADMLRWARGDFFGAILAGYDTLGAKRVAVMFFTSHGPSRSEQCTILRTVNPPLSGYGADRDLALVSHMTMACAAATEDRPRENTVFAEVAHVIGVRLQTLETLRGSRCALRPRIAESVALLYNSLGTYGLAGDRNVHARQERNALQLAMIGLQKTRLHVPARDILVLHGKACGSERLL